MGVETALAIGGMAVSAGGAIASFSQASKQQSLMDQAQEDAQKAMAEAKKKLDINYYKQLAIPKEAYELEREALISSGAQAIQAGVESERGAAATAGRVQMAQTEAQAGQRTAMAKELADLAKLTATEESRLRDIKVDLDLGEVEGQQRMIADAARAKSQAIQQGFSSLSSFAGQAAKLAPLYSKQGEQGLSQGQRTKLQQEVAFNPYKDIKGDTGDYNENIFMEPAVTSSNLSPEEEQAYRDSISYILNRPK